jgi:hypothetical protein
VTALRDFLCISKIHRLQYTVVWLLKFAFKIKKIWFLFFQMRRKDLRSDRSWCSRIVLRSCGSSVRRRRLQTLLSGRMCPLRVDGMVVLSFGNYFNYYFLFLQPPKGSGFALETMHGALLSHWTKMTVNYNQYITYFEL